MGTNPTGDDTTTTIATNVKDLTLRYFDSFDNLVSVATPLDWTNGAADEALLGSIRGIAISITVQDQTESTVTTTLTSGVSLRNMGN
jgi:hypothetical protein